MLYITTRDKTNAYTAYRTLALNRSSDGGVFLPFRMPELDGAFIQGLGEKSFGQNVADILNLFYGARLDGWDVDFCIGRYPTKMVPMSHRITVAEMWHNPDNDYARVVRNLSGRIRGLGDTTDLPTNWAWISIRIATLFGLYGELVKRNVCDGRRGVDVALPSGDFAGPMAVWYARRMGLPIGSIICSCDEHDGAWSLLRNGELPCSGETTIPSDLERLIYGVCGGEEVARYSHCVQMGKTYAPPAAKVPELVEGLYPAVISWQRRERIIQSVYSTSSYILDPGSAMAYGGLQDYRATEGETRPALILTERSPICSEETVARAMGITVEVLKDRLNLN